MPSTSDAAHAVAEEPAEPLERVDRLLLGVGGRQLPQLGGDLRDALRGRRVGRPRDRQRTTPRQSPPAAARAPRWRRRAARPASVDALVGLSARRAAAAGRAARAARPPPPGSSASTGSSASSMVAGARGVARLRRQRRGARRSRPRARRERLGVLGPGVGIGPVLHLGHAGRGRRAASARTRSRRTPTAATAQRPSGSSARLDDPGHGAHVGAHVVAADLAPPLDQHDTELPVAGQAVVHQRPVARLEHVQRQARRRARARSRAGTSGSGTSALLDGRTEGGDVRHARPGRQRLHHVLLQRVRRPLAARRRDGHVDDEGEHQRRVVVVHDPGQRRDTV